MKTADILISALTSDPDIRVLEQDPVGRRLHLAAGPMELDVTWDERDDTMVSAAFPMVLPDAVRHLPEWRHQLDKVVHVIEADRDAFVTCSAIADDPWTVEVRVRVLADGLTRHHLLAAVEELKKVQRVLVHHLEGMSIVASQTAEMISMIDALVVPAQPAPTAGHSFAPPQLPA